MPLFQSHPAPAPPPPPPPPARTGFFSSLRTPASTASGNSDYRSATSHPAHDNDAASVRSGFFFGRRRSAESLASVQTTQTTQTKHSRFSTSSSRTSTPPTSPDTRTTTLRKSASLRSSGGSSLLSRFASPTAGTGTPHKDPSVLAARDKIARAAEAEAEADRAVLHARARVRDAMESVKELEGEAEGEAKRAKAKGVVARLVGRDAGRLGRHGEA